MRLLPQPPKRTLKAFLKQRPLRSDMDLFKKGLATLMKYIDANETEEFHKNLVSDFLKNSLYHHEYFINTKGRQDLVIHNGKDNKSSVGVIIEAKRPANKSDWFTAEKPNSKALQELVLYYLRERIECNNIDIKYLIATNINEWYIIEAKYFESLFYRNKALVRGYEEWRDGKKVTRDTNLFYNEIAKPFIDQITDEIPCTYFNIQHYVKALNNEDKLDDKNLIALLKILSPQYLLKVPFANDSNELDEKFYKELLHIIGLEEAKEGSKNIIRRKITNINSASLLEMAIKKLQTKGIHKIPDLTIYGETTDEQYFNIALELCITWINRILFLKLLEGQLKSYHKNTGDYSFLNTKLIVDFDELFNLFHNVLAVDIQNRQKILQQKYECVPYLNSSLFEITELEDVTISVDSLDNSEILDYISTTILKEHKKKNEPLTTLHYLFEFLDAYDFASEGSEDIQEDNKPLINASVLGKVFEKINGYKDGSIYTPGYITMYMCRQSIRMAVVQKFNDVKGWKIKDFDDLYNQIDSIDEANTIINDLKICDPAVGSGHFLVSALNEIIAIKSELKILKDKTGKRLKEYTVEVENDELYVTDEEGDIFKYIPGNKERQRIQETLFQEKQIIIENCLFGVDINPNSVKICRLRLWIELLKNAFYKGETGYRELETLPNIDINIKCGNSLISRFGLKTDVFENVPNFKKKLEDYKFWVNQYKNAKDRSLKRQLTENIRAFTKDFKKRDPKVVKLKNELEKKSKAYYERFVTQKLFAEITDPKILKEKEKLEKEMESITSSIELLILDNNYKNAFEWRFEFPEVLNEVGKFEGFDVVIGNPPYVDLKGLNPKLVKTLFENFKSTTNRINLYSIFIELGLNLLNKKGYFTFINPNSILMNSSYAKIRQLIFQNIHEIIKLPDNIFSDSNVKVETIIISFQKSVKHKFVNVIRYKHNENISYINAALIEKQSKLFWGKFEELKYYIYLTEDFKNIINKILNGSAPLGENADFSLGITPYDKYRGHSAKEIKERAFHSSEKLNNEYKPVITGENIQRYFISSKPKEYIRYGDWLGAPREERFFNEPRVIIRQIVSGNPPRIYAGFTNEPLYFTQIGFGIIPKTEINPKYLTAILNSSVINFIHKYLYLDIEKHLFSKILIENCKKLPIKVISFSAQQPFITLVNQILEAKLRGIGTSHLENKIDDLVYELYGITEEERKVIETN